MSFKMIKLKDLISLHEAEKEEEKGFSNPFAAASDKKTDADAPADAGGEEADTDPAADEKGGEDEETGGAKDTAAPKFPIKFNKAKVKRYNNAEFISSQGELKSIDKKGIIVTVQPDNVDIFVNFSDIL